MIYAYIGRNRKLCLRPSDPEGEDELREFVKNLKQNGLDVIDVEVEMPEEQYRDYQQQKQRYGYSKQSGSHQGFGFQPSSYIPQPPDFSPQSHLPMWPFVLPYILERGGSYSGQDRVGRDQGDQSNYRNDHVIRGQRTGEYDGTPNENPRDTGRSDVPRR